MALQYNLILGIILYPTKKCTRSWEHKSNNTFSNPMDVGTYIKSLWWLSKCHWEFGSQACPTFIVLTELCCWQVTHVLKIDSYLVVIAILVAIHSMGIFMDNFLNIHLKWSGITKSYLERTQRLCSQNIKQEGSSSSSVPPASTLWDVRLYRDLPCSSLFGLMSCSSFILVSLSSLL